MHRGYVKLYRCMEDHYLWQEKPYDRARAWLDLVKLANYRDGHIRVRGIKIVVKRGQVGWSVLSLAEKWGWSRGKVSRFLVELQNEHQIEQQNNKLTSLITITNYDKYQSDSTTDETTERATDDTTDRATDGQQTDTNKKVKKEKKINLYSEDFEIFWKAYPKKTAKGAAMGEWKKAKPPLPEVLKALEWQTKSKKWIDGYILDPERYIKRRCWEDEPENKPYHYKDDPDALVY